MKVTALVTAQPVTPTPAAENCVRRWGWKFQRILFCCEGTAAEAIRAVSVGGGDLQLSPEKHLAGCWAGLQAVGRARRAAPRRAALRRPFFLRLRRPFQDFVKNPTASWKRAPQSAKRSRLVLRL